MKNKQIMEIFFQSYENITFSVWAHEKKIMTPFCITQLRKNPNFRVFRI